MAVALRRPVRVGVVTDAPVVLLRRLVVVAVRRLCGDTGGAHVAPAVPDPDAAHAPRWPRAAHDPRALPPPPPPRRPVDHVVHLQLVRLGELRLCVRRVLRVHRHVVVSTDAVVAAPPVVAAHHLSATAPRPGATGPALVVVLRVPLAGPVAVVRAAHRGDHVADHPPPAGPLLVHRQVPVLRHPLLPVALRLRVVGWGIVRHRRGSRQGQTPPEASRPPVLGLVAEDAVGLPRLRLQPPRRQVLLPQRPPDVESLPAVLYLLVRQPVARGLPVRAYVLTVALRGRAGAEEKERLVVVARWPPPPPPTPPPQPVRPVEKCGGSDRSRRPSRQVGL